MADNLGKFRRFYNDELHQKLVEFEAKRYRLLLRVFFLAFLLVAASILVISLGVFALSFFLVIPWYGWWSYYRRQVHHFREEFKPAVVNEILKFIDPSLRYYHKEHIPRDTFLRAGIFPVNPDYYKGEDYIMGKIGDIFFELCELEVSHPSPLEGKMVNWFEGIFFHANFFNNFKGHIVMIPRAEWQAFIPMIKEFTKYGGGELKNLGDDKFRREFAVYADKDANYRDLLRPTLLRTINNYHLESGKKVYVAFVDSHFFIAIAEPYELLEAHIFISNLDFKTIALFYEELLLFTRIVEDFDVRA
jgi:hypothetical protein